MENQNIPWGAISAKLKNAAGEKEEQLIQNWLDASPEHVIILSEIVHIWSVTKGKPEFYQPDMSYNWEKLMEKIKVEPKSKTHFPIFLKWVAAAAVLVLVFLAGFSLRDATNQPSATFTYSKIVAPKGNKSWIILPDSSKVWLNSGAELRYPSNFTTQNREVWMKGECYFEVTKDKNHPFVVHGTQLQVKVYGTSFNVREHERTHISDVTLVSGLVKVEDLQNNKISDLVPGQQLRYSNGAGVVMPAENMEALTSWINNILIFNNQPFDEVIGYLSGWYGVTIKFDHSLYDHHKYTFKVKTESLREVLELINIITPIDYQIEGDQIIIKYKSRM